MPSTQVHGGDDAPENAAERVPEPLGSGPDSRRVRTALAVAALAALTVLAYCNTFRSPFVFDDTLQIVRNPMIRDLSLFRAPWRIDEAGLEPDHVAGFRTRYVAYLTLALDYRLHGTKVVGYHLTNLALHLAAALTLLAAVRLLLASPRFERSRLRDHELAVAVLVAGLFALHPLQTQAVTYVVQRMASLAGLLCLLSLWAQLRARSAPGRGERGAFAALSALALLAAFFTKQNAYVFPLILILVDLAAFPGSWRERRRWLAVPLCGIAVVALLGAHHLGAGERTGASDALAEGEGARERPGIEAPGGLTAGEYRRTQINVLATYLRLWLVPVGQSLDHDYPISRRWSEPRVLGSALLLAGLAGAGATLLLGRGLRDPGWRLVGLGIAWFFLAHAVESSGIELIDTIVEHRMYLPSAGLCLALVVALTLLLPERRLPMAFSLLAAAALVLGAATWARNEVWRSDLRLWQDVLANYPNRVRALEAVAERLLALRRVEEADEYLRRAHELAPRRASVLVQLGVVARVRGESDVAEAWFRQAVAVEPDHWIALVNLGDLALARGEREAAAALYEQAARHEQLSAIARGKLDRMRAGRAAEEEAGLPADASREPGAEP